MLARLRHGGPGSRLPITPASVFHVASISKEFTAASILMLDQEGKLSIDDDIHKYIPELQDFGVRITLRHLLHHSSGMRDQWSLLGLAGWRHSLAAEDAELSSRRTLSVFELV
jgi:CubicO group peptidase (beta-lactamase class C family)